MNSKISRGLESLQDISSEWNALWLRSPVSYPGCRAENIALWMRRFHPERELRLVTVRNDEQLVAALPLVEQPSKFGLPVWALTANCWAANGDLLLDPEFSVDDLCGQLVKALGGESWSLIKFDTVSTESQRWRSFCNALKSGGHQLRESCGGPIAVTDVLQDWPAYQASWSGNHRHSVKKAIKRLGQQGDVQADCFTGGSETELNSIITECFQLEDKTWKGEAGTSAIKSDMLEYFLEEAQTLHRNNMLHVWQLRLDGQLIAFEYCPVSDAVVYSNKISFDPGFSKFSPGNVLRFYQQQHYHEDGQTRLFDMMGITCRNKAKWATRTYVTGNLVAARGTIGNLALSIGGWLKPPAQTADPVPNPGAVQYLQTSGGSTPMMPL